MLHEQLLFFTFLEVIKIISSKLEWDWNWDWLSACLCLCLIFLLSSFIFSCFVILQLLSLVTFSFIFQLDLRLTHRVFSQKHVQTTCTWKILFFIWLDVLVWFYFDTLKRVLIQLFLFFTYFLEFFNQTLTVDLHTNTKIQESYTSNNLDKIHETKRRLLQWVLRFEYHRTTGHCSPSPRILF